jgi:putative FmdB family regulatory protein
MPTYEYECRKCHHRFEESQSISAKPLQTCPQCKGKVDRVISGGSGFLFKGSGFYITDHRSKEYKDQAKAEKPEAKPDTKSESKSEAKPESKPEAVKAAADRLKDKGAAE